MQIKKTLTSLKIPLKIKPLSKREKVIFYITTLVFGSILLFNFVVEPLGDKLSLMNEDMRSKEEMLNKYTQLINKGGGIVSVYENYKETMQAEITVEEADAALFKELKGLATRFSLNLEQVRPQPIEKKNEYNEVALETVLTGSFSSVFKFIQGLEDNAVSTRIMSLRFMSRQGEKNKVQCKFRLSKVFFAK